jgi:flagellar motor switch/type III secretory pathway protein FliN
VSEENTSEQGGSGIEGLGPWDPFTHLRVVSTDVAHYSGGFLSSHPQKWFPSIAAQWLPLALSLNLEIQVQEVNPSLELPQNLGTTFVGEFLSELVGIAFDKDTEALLGEHIVGPGTLSRGILLEYIARRLFTSLSNSWTGPQKDSPTVFLGVSNEPTSHFMRNRLGGVEVLFSVMGRNCLVWISLGREIVDQIDGLWKRQLRSATKTFREGGSIELEIARIGIPAGEVSEYLQPGAVIELETPVDDKVILRSAGKPWAVGRVCIVGEHFGIELMSRTVPEDGVYEDIEIVSVRFPQVVLEVSHLAEIAQVGTIIPTVIPVGASVELTISNTLVARAILNDYRGSFAITII